jgi:hypothetical protein
MAMQWQSLQGLFKHELLEYICCDEQIYNSMFGCFGTTGCLRFSPKTSQESFFAKYILCKEDNLGALWVPASADTAPYSRLLGIGELEFSDVVTHRYSVAIDAMRKTLMKAKTRMLDGNPGGREHEVKLICSVMDRGCRDTTKGPWFLFEEYLTQAVGVVLTVVSGGDLRTCCNMFLSANEVGKALSDLDRVKVRMLLAAEGADAEATMDSWANEWDQTYLQLSKYRIAFGTIRQNGSLASSTAFDELFVAAIIGIYDPGLVHAQQRSERGDRHHSFVLDLFLNERGDEGTFDVSVAPNFFKDYFQPNAQALLILFDWKTYGAAFGLSSGGASAKQVLKRAIMRDTIRSRLRSISVDFFCNYNRKDTTYWLPVMAYMLRQFGDLETMPLLDEVLRHLHAQICWYVVVTKHKDKKARAIIPALLRCFSNVSDATSAKAEIMKVVENWRTENGAVLVAKLATLCLERNTGLGSETISMILRLYEDTLRLSAFKKLEGDSKTLDLFNARYSSVAQDAFTRTMVREKGMISAEHFIAILVEPRHLDPSWRSTKQGVATYFCKSLGNLCLLPLRINQGANNDPPLAKVNRYNKLLAGIETVGPAPSAEESDESDPEPGSADEMSDPDDDEDGELPNPAPVAVTSDDDEDDTATAWTPSPDSLMRCWSLNDLLTRMNGGDFTTAMFGQRLEHMHTTILVHLGFAKPDNHPLWHFYTTSDKKIENSKPPDVPGFPNKSAYIKMPSSAIRLTTRHREAHRTAASSLKAAAMEENEDGAAGPSKRRRCAAAPAGADDSVDDADDDSDY